MGEYAGILFIGDPHLASRVPGFRKDDYPVSILNKVAWCLEYARAERLLPALLGDIFDRPRDNSNWLMGELLALLGRQEVIGLYGNHDCREDQLTEHDSLSVLVKSGWLRLVDESHPWSGVMGGMPIVIGGTSWGQRLPRAFQPPVLGGKAPLVFWMAHHDVRVPGYEEQGHFEPFELGGVDVVVNGHIHRSLGDVRRGKTLWIVPGNITRVARSDLTKGHVPAALRIDIGAGTWRRQMVAVPHEPFAEVFHPELPVAAAAVAESAFVQGLAELQARRTETGAGLRQFIVLNEAALEPEVRVEIWKLFAETEEHDTQTPQPAE